MGEWKDPAWYDNWYKSNPAPSDVLTRLHDEVAKAVLVEDPRVVFDFGCGPGWFEQRLRAAGFRGSYVGEDTSAEALRMARANRASGRIFDLAFSYISAYLLAARDIVQPNPTCDDLVTFIEVLEHLEDDVGTVEQIVPAGNRVLVTVPTFDSASHVRWFSPEDDIAKRYALTNARQRLYGPHILCVGTKE